MPNSRNILELYDVSPPPPAKKKASYIGMKTIVYEITSADSIFTKNCEERVLYVETIDFSPKGLRFQDWKLIKSSLHFSYFSFLIMHHFKDKMGYWYWKELHWYPWNLWVIGRCPHFSITFLQYLINFGTEDMFPKSFLLPLVRVGINCTVVKKILAKYK